MPPRQPRSVAGSTALHAAQGGYDSRIRNAGTIEKIAWRYARNDMAGEICASGAWRQHDLALFIAWLAVEEPASIG